MNNFTKKCWKKVEVFGIKILKFWDNSYKNFDLSNIIKEIIPQKHHGVAVEVMLRIILMIPFSKTTSLKQSLANTGIKVSAYTYLWDMVEPIKYQSFVEKVSMKILSDKDFERSIKEGAVTGS
jgi:hypothetical protein